MTESFFFDCTGSSFFKKLSLKFFFQKKNKKTKSKQSPFFIFVEIEWSNPFFWLQWKFFFQNDCSWSSFFKKFSLFSFSKSSQRILFSRRKNQLTWIPICLQSEKHLTHSLFFLLALSSFFKKKKRIPFGDCVILNENYWKRNFKKRKWNEMKKKKKKRRRKFKREKKNFFFAKLFFMFEILCFITFSQ